MKLKATHEVSVFDLFTKIACDTGAVDEFSVAKFLTEQLGHAGLYQYKILSPSDCGLRRFYLFFDALPEQFRERRYKSADEVRRHFPPDVVRLFEELDRGTYELPNH